MEMEVRDIRDRTKKGRIMMWSILFLVGLVVFILLMLFIFFIYPKWFGTDDLEGALQFQPRPDQKENAGSTLIWINRYDKKNNPPWVKILDDFFQKFYLYNKQNEGQPPLNCDYGGQSSSDTQACFLDIASMSEQCSKEMPNYGYEDGKPCVLIKLNKIYGWVPEPYNTTDDIKLAEENGMPKELLTKLKNLVAKKDSMLDTVWISCEGENPVDIENIGPVEYYSPVDKFGQFQGIPCYYFPFKNQDHYREPFVFVKFVKPQLNVLINIECKAWAKNIKPNHDKPLGSVHFELMID